MLGKKSSEKSAKNVFLYSQNIVNKKFGGKKRAKQFFQKHTNGAIKKCWEKTTANICEQTFFLKSHKHRYQKMGEKRAKQFFQKHTNMLEQKCWEKICRKNFRKKFLYSLEYHDQKMAGKNARINFSRNTRMVRAKMLGKKSRKKVKNMVFYIHTNIVTKKLGGKTSETIFPETHE